MRHLFLFLIAAGALLLATRRDGTRDVALESPLELGDVTLQAESAALEPALPTAATLPEATDVGEMPTATRAAVAHEALEPGGLHVRVLHSDGRPAAGIRVGLAVELARTRSTVEARGARVTRGDGRARLDLRQARRVLDMASREAGYPLVLRAEVPASQAVEHRFDGPPAEGQRVELQLPPMGSVRVRVEDPDGRPPADEASLAWWWAEPDGAPAYRRPPRNRLTTVGGEAVLDGIGVGVLVKLEAQAGVRVPASAVDVPGPERAGGVREITLTLGPRTGPMRYRVIGVDGMPLANAELRTAHVPEFGPPPEELPRSAWRKVETDGDGVVHLEREVREWEPRSALLVQGGRDKRGVEGRLLLPRAAPSDELLDLGDVQLIATNQ